MEENFMLKYLEQLVQVYGFWAILLVALTFLLMIPLNMLIKKAFKKGETNEGITRLRKIVSSMSVFVIAFVVLLAYVLIAHKYYGKTRLAFDTVYIGMLSMVCWGMFKALRDMGLKKLVYIIIDKFKSPIKSMLKTIQLPTNITDTIYKNMCSFIEDSDGLNSVIVTEQEKELTHKIESMMNGFVSSEIIKTEANKMYECLKEKYNDKL